MVKTKLNIFGFEDYRKYLKEYYQLNKSVNGNKYSYAVMARDAGFKGKSAKSLICNIIKGKQNLTETTISKMAKYLEFDTPETEYFRNIVMYANLLKKNDPQYSLYHQLAIIIKCKFEMDYIHRNRCEYYSQWYHSAVRELIDIYNVNNENCDQLCNILKPSISTVQLKESLILLKELGFIESGKDGFYHQTKRIINTSKSIPQEIKNQSHVGYLCLAKNAIESIPPDSRYVISHTIGISKETYTKITREIESFRERFSSLIYTDTKPDSIYQLQVVLFPLSSPKKDFEKGGA